MLNGHFYRPCNCKSDGDASSIRRDRDRVAIPLALLSFTHTCIS